MNRIKKELGFYSSRNFLIFSILYFLYFISEARNVIYSEEIVKAIYIFGLTEYALAFQTAILLSSLMTIFIFFLNLDYRLYRDIVGYLSIVIIVGFVITMNWWVLFAMTLQFSKVSKFIRWFIYFFAAFELIDGVDRIFPPFDAISSLPEFWAVVDSWGGLVCFMFSVMFCGRAFNPPPNVARRQ